jgi:hypothetical protein
MNMNTLPDVPLLQRCADLQPVGEGDELRTLNEGPDDWERDNVIERTDGSIKVFCDLMRVTHGTLGSEKDAQLASLMVFRFRFDSDEGRRILNATLSIEFSDVVPATKSLELYAIAPFERWSILPTTENQSTSTEGKLSLGASGVPFVDLGGSLRIEKTTSRDMASSTTVSGMTEMPAGRMSGPRTRAVWKLRENERKKTGIPDSLSVAVLLTRKTDEPFTATVEIESRADPRTGFGRWFRKIPLDDPVLFNPRETKERKIMDIVRGRSEENLGDKELHELVKTRMSTKAFWVNDDEE